MKWNIRQTTVDVVAGIMLLLVLMVVAGEAVAQQNATANAEAKAHVLSLLQPLKDRSESMAKAFWKNPELGFLETKTSARMQRELKKAGFSIEKGVAGIPTAFVASYGTGEPVIGILAEMDALPGASQAAVPRRQEIAGRHNQHSCGHHLFAASSVVAAIAVKQWLAKTGQQGTIRLYGTPAEEGGSGKVYLVREGLFDDVDTALHWHPAGINAAPAVNNNAVISAKFRFYGQASHASLAPDKGRSALDGVEVMNYAVNMMREHIPNEARIHYVISNGGEVPNTVPEFAEVYYYARDKSTVSVKALWQRIVKASKGAALATETKVEHEILHAIHNLLSNQTLQQRIDANLRARTAKVRWTEDETEFAKTIYDTLSNPWVGFEGTESTTAPFQEIYIPGSTDVGDVSWVVPTGGFAATTWAPSTDPHTWQATAAGGTGIAHKGMHVASEVLAMTAVDLYLDSALRDTVTAEFNQRRGADFQYESLLGDKQPALDYRKSDSHGDMKR